MICAHGPRSFSMSQVNCWWEIRSLSHRLFFVHRILNGLWCAKSLFIFIPFPLTLLRDDNFVCFLLIIVDFQEFIHFSFRHLPNIHIYPKTFPAALSWKPNPNPKSFSQHSYPDPAANTWYYSSSWIYNFQSPPTRPDRASSLFTK